jgi:hypothetical protein
MSKPLKFVLLREEFVEGEKRWTYKSLIIFNRKKIKEATITDHYELAHKEKVNKGLIMELLHKMNGENLKPLDYSGVRKVYKWEVNYRDHWYRLIFWFKDNSSDHLWIRNCYPID